MTELPDSMWRRREPFLPPNRGELLRQTLAVAAYIVRNQTSFQGWIALMRKYHICFAPYCTTCGGGSGRNIIRCLTDEQLQKIVFGVTLHQIRVGWNDEWDDLVTLILKERPASLFEGSDLLRLYRMAHEMHQKLINKYSWGSRHAWAEACQMVRSGGVDCWMELESAKKVLN